MLKQQENNDECLFNEVNRTAAAIFWILSLICMGTIFYMSSNTSTESSAQSGRILMWLNEVLKAPWLSDFIVRKSAHFLEFAGLSLLLCAAFTSTCGRKKMALGLVTASAYAATDEVHQIFVDGRSCQFSDWILDTCGAIAGLVLFVLLFILAEHISKQKKRRAASA